MNFSFVDRILHSEPGKHAVGIKQVTADDCYLMQNARGQTVLYPALIGEALGQLGAWSVMQACDFKLRPVAGVVHQVTVLNDAAIGDSILLETHIDHWDEQAIHYNSVGSVNGKTIFEIERALGPMLPMSDFNDPIAIKKQFEQIYHPDHVGCAPYMLDSPVKLRPGLDPGSANDKDRRVKLQSMGFDKILRWQKGEQVVAQKTIDANDPYFADHFPKKAVLPLTILLHCKLTLAKQFLVDLLGKEQAEHYRTYQLNKIKMREFVLPGSVLTSEMTVIEQQQQICILQFDSQVEGKRVCIARVSFIKEQQDKCRVRHAHQTVVPSSVPTLR